MASRSRGRLTGGDRFWLGPVVAAGVLLALAGVYLALSRPSGQARQATPTLLGVTADQIAALGITAQGKSLTLVANTDKTGNVTWTIGTAGGPPADQALVQGFVSDLVTLQASRTLIGSATAADLQQYGLQPPQSTLVIQRGAGKPPVELDIGQTAPTGEYYARVGGRPAIYLIDGMVPAEISADPNAWLPTPSATSPASSAASASGSSAAGTAATPASGTGSSASAGGG